MINRTHKTIILLTSLIVTITSCNSDKRIPLKKPNIIYIMADDLTTQAISAYGHNLNNTPNIDRIANEGMLFNNASVTNSICAPSRAVILTGKHSHLNGKIDNFVTKSAEKIIKEKIKNISKIIKELKEIKDG